MKSGERLKACGLVAAGGLLLSGAWLTAHLVPVLPLAAAAILLGFRRVDGWRDALWCSLAGTIAYHGLCAMVVYGLVRYSWLAVAFHPMVIAYFAPSWIALFLLALLLERKLGVPRSVAVILLWPLLERLRTIGDLSLPVDLLAHSSGAAPVWLAWTPWIGPFGFSLVVWSAGGLLVLAWDRRDDWRRATVPAAAGLGLWIAQPATAAGLSTGAGDDGGAPLESLRVALVQPCVDVRDKLDRGRWPVLWQRLERLTRQAAASRPDLIVWPETTRPGPILWKAGQPIDDPRVRELSEELDVPILYGCEIAKIRGRRVLSMYNGAAMVRPEGQPLEWYGKQRLLPFVEGVPFAGLFGGGGEETGAASPGRSSLLTLMGNFSPGPRPTVFEVGGARIGLLVCYEAIYPSLGRRCVAAGANTLLVITNDAWWGGNAFASWHAQVAAIQARALDVPVLRAANSGLTAAYDRDGDREESAELDEITVLEAGFSPGRSGGTFYGRHGDAVLAGLLMLWGAAVAAARRSGVTWAAPSPGEEG